MRRRVYLLPVCARPASLLKTIGNIQRLPGAQRLTNTPTLGQPPLDVLTMLLKVVGGVYQYPKWFFGSCHIQRARLLLYGFQLHIRWQCTTNLIECQ
jgi:hypothetical protein